jgi:O-antigen/teichoic acid export membrane protein
MHGSVSGPTAQYLINVVAQGASRGLSMGASFLVFVLVARAWGTESFGHFAFVMAFVSIAASLADVGTTAALARSLPREKSADAGRFMGNYLMLRGVLAVGVSLMAALASRIIKPDLAEPLLIAALAIPFVASRFFEPVYQTFERPRYSVQASLVFGLTQLAIAYLTIVVLGVGLAGYLYGYIISHVVYCITATRLMWRVVVPRFEIDTARLRAIVVLAAPMGVSALFNTVNLRADVVMLSYLRSASEVGLYNTASRFLDLAVAITVTATLPLVPILSRSFATGREATRPACRRAMEIATLVTVPVALVAPYVAEPLMALIFGEQYRPAAVVVPIFAWLFVLAGYGLVCSSINLAAGNIRHAYWNGALAACVNISMNLFLIPRYGIVGAAWATLSSTLFMVTVSQFYVWRNVGNVFAPWRWARILVLALALQTGLFLSAKGGAQHLSIVLLVLLYVAAVPALRLVSKADLMALIDRSPRATASRDGQSG